MLRPGGLLPPGRRDVGGYALTVCWLESASCSFAVSSSDSDVRITVPPYLLSAAMALSGVTFSMTRKSADAGADRKTRERDEEEQPEKHAPEPAPPRTGASGGTAVGGRNVVLPVRI